MVDEQDEIEITNEPLTRERAQEAYVVTLRPESRSLRDGYLQSFNQHYKIGKLYAGSGGVLYEGKTATEWMQTFRIIPSNKSSMTMEEVKGTFMKLAQAYHTASSFHANLRIASEKLEALINEKEASFISLELAKYRRGGDYWDEDLGKCREKRPAKEALERMAENYAAELRKALRDLQMEVSFFQHILADLEAQRRCLKDYAEIGLQEARSNL